MNERATHSPVAADATLGVAAPTGYMPQLDALRAFAVLGVFTSHFLPKEHWANAYVDLGSLGVKLFFVLSGFLIAGTLFQARAHIDEGRLSRPRAFFNFYMRRFLRLLPAYYLYILMGLVLLPGFVQHVGWFLAYAANFLFANEPRTYVTFMPHFWTLAIEEQFYLVMPWMMILMRPRWLVASAVVMVFLGPIFRLAGLLTGFDMFQIRMMMPAHLDTLGMGVLLAAMTARFGMEGAATQRLLRAALWIGLPAATTLLTLEAMKVQPDAVFVLLNLALGFLFCWVIARASTGFGGIIGTVLTWTPLLFLGRISYGLYVYHFNVPGLIRDHLFPSLGETLQDWPSVRYLIYAAVAILIATGSWYLMERPVNRLKSRFSCTGN